MIHTVSDGIFYSLTETLEPGTCLDEVSLPYINHPLIGTYKIQLIQHRQDCFRNVVNMRHSVKQSL